MRQLKSIFPDREIVEIEPPHPIYSVFYKMDKYPQIPGLGSFFQGRTWEKGGFVAHLRGILDDTINARGPTAEPTSLSGLRIR